ncbi:hypothetical protein KKD19_06495 [Patescibacteria group bacterium]|nr:hypothetical protein [Patescibacteria group bacterium]MBU4512851.1 hypothetical protein [Patescibacteria group bacterium]MCG2693626.1 hypothetical protein [Candidatus Parcubacteria bacterium]
MYQEQLDPRRLCWKKPVYLLVVLAFLYCVLPIRDIAFRIVDDIRNFSENRIVEVLKAEAAWQVREKVCERALLKGKDYGPEDFFNDRAVLVTVRSQINGRITASNISGLPVDISKTIDETLRGLYEMAHQNFSRMGDMGSEKLSREEQARNSWRWHEAEIKAPLPEGFEPLASSINWLAFGRWLLITYVCFLPFAFILILFQLWLKGNWQAMWQEPFLRARYFFLAVLAGPIGVAIYSGFDPALKWRFTKLRADYCRQAGNWRLSPAEENTLWLQAEQPILNFQEALLRVKEMPELVARKSRLAMAVSCLSVVISSPFLAFSTSFALGQNEERVMIIKLVNFKEGEDLEKLDCLTVWVATVIDYVLPARPQTTAAKVEQTEAPANRWANRAWFLPPSLAPPAKLKEVVP